MNERQHSISSERRDAWRLLVGLSIVFLTFFIVGAALFFWKMYAMLHFGVAP
jgi:hypothetical protein